ncbi:hypothetical protein [Nostoc sp. FACHB-888]|uniref:hypothetical protein n=1 Tax=Nostoc sp. FACHB-888 TaxID=2692842 RepID=UPI0016821396|nr:hypothetical protein [Nostoc sp. FACHB-888]MBD2247090.1 hypothetical protein [Nostoc sp. FACHB-888]
MASNKNIQNKDGKFFGFGKFDSVFNGGQTRRKFLKYMMLSAIGVTGTTVTLSLWHKPGFTQVNRQGDWQWCRKCQALSFVGNDSLGACPAGGVHDHRGSGQYVLILNSPNVKGQDNWRWCNKCQVLAFAGNQTLGICAAGGVHNHQGSGNYVLKLNEPNYPGQKEWRWCIKCQELNFGGNDSLGSCPAGGVHNNLSSGDYTLEIL